MVTLMTIIVDLNKIWECHLTICHLLDRAHTLTQSVWEAQEVQAVQAEWVQEVQ